MSQLSLFAEAPPEKEKIYSDLSIHEKINLRSNQQFWQRTNKSLFDWARTEIENWLLDHPYKDYLFNAVCHYDSRSIQVIPNFTKKISSW